MNSSRLLHLHMDSAMQSVWRGLPRAFQFCSRRKEIQVPGSPLADTELCEQDLYTVIAGSLSHHRGKARHRHSAPLCDSTVSGVCTL